MNKVTLIILLLTSNLSYSNNKISLYTTKDSFILPYSNDSLVVIVNAKNYRNKKKRKIVNQIKEITFFLDSMFYDKRKKYSRLEFSLGDSQEDFFNIKNFKNRNRIASLDKKIDAILFEKVVSFWFSDIFKIKDRNFPLEINNYLQMLFSQSSNSSTNDELFNNIIIYQNTLYDYNNIVAVYNIIQVYGDELGFFRTIYESSLVANKLSISFKQAFFSLLKDKCHIDLQQAYSSFIANSPIPILKVTITKENSLSFYWENQESDFVFPIKITVDSITKLLNTKTSANYLMIKPDERYVFHSINNSLTDVLLSSSKNRILFYIRVVNKM